MITILKIESFCIKANIWNVSVLSASSQFLHYRITFIPTRTASLLPLSVPKTFLETWKN